MKASDVLKLKPGDPVVVVYPNGQKVRENVSRVDTTGGEWIATRATPGGEVYEVIRRCVIPVKRVRRYTMEEIKSAWDSENVLSWPDLRKILESLPRKEGAK